MSNATTIDLFDAHTSTQNICYVCYVPFFIHRMFHNMIYSTINIRAESKQKNRLRNETHFVLITEMPHILAGRQLFLYICIYLHECIVSGLFIVCDLNMYL